MSMGRWLRACAPLAAITLGFACGSATEGDSRSGAGDAGSTAPVGLVGAGSGAAGADGGDSLAIAPSGPVTDFPSPILDGNAPPNAPSLFGPPSQGAASGGPCLVEPESDVLYPQNWVRPRFRWTAANGETLFELRLHAANQLQDLVVYTTSTSWTMPRAAWDALRTHSPGVPMTVTIRGAQLAGAQLQGEATGSSGPIGIAPVRATGAIVYWTTSGGSALKGFSPGDEGVVPVLVPSQVGESPTTCIGCHTSTPDGAYAAFSFMSSQNTAWFPNALARIDADAGAVGAPPSFLGAGAIAALARYDLGIGVFSPAHYQPGDRREVVTYDGSGGTSAALSWIDLEATDPSAATGTVARAGDPRSAAAPTWSHDGATIAYVSTTHFCDGRVGRCGSQYAAPDDPGSTADVYEVPYAGGAGGAASPLAGASDPGAQEYYPSFSPDDRWVAFDRAPNDVNMYDQPQAEVYVVPASGGSPVRIAANDPPACAGKTSPGLTNSWPKWGPGAATAGSSTYYWLVFSSTRSDGGNPQLYMTSIVAAPDGSLATHGAVYLWNEPSSENNHTPAWDAFKVPPVPVPK
jgi:hypothetical protein